MKLKIALTQNDYEIPLNGSTPYTYLAGRLGGDDSALMASYIKLSQSTAPLHSTLPPVLLCLTYRVTGVQTLHPLTFFYSLTRIPSHACKYATALQTPAP